ncbi:hypothetical protein HNR19_000285 [Nocardioides thalensis]|uniref:Uncharacterized protein n=1 Tax=Nocardioides thalensis TaxID=1914755 RepID=A0A853BXL9_9ACTN|nr:hypothetical protein [Nocardioides thalensis]
MSGAGTTDRPPSATASITTNSSTETTRVRTKSPSREGWALYPEMFSLVIEPRMLFCPENQECQDLGCPIAAMTGSAWQAGTASRLVGRSCGATRGTEIAIRRQAGPQPVVAWRRSSDSNHVVGGEVPRDCAGIHAGLRRPLVTHRCRRAGRGAVG